MRLKNENHHLRVINRGLMLVIFGLVSTVIILSYWLAKAMDARPIAIPPDLRAGAVIRGHEVSPETVYTFAITLFQQLNRWRADGGEEYRQNIDSLVDYLTPSFRETLHEDLRERQRQGELNGRTRTTSLLPGVVYAADRVTIKSANEWVVHLDLELIETLNGAPVKQAHIRYPVKVVRFEVDWERNPWGLALDGFAGAGPVRIQDLR